MHSRISSFVSLAFAIMAIAIAVEGCRTWRFLELWVFHGTSGQPLAIGFEHGVIQLAISNVPTQMASPGSLDHQRWALVTFEEGRNEIVCSADWQVGYIVTSGAGMPYADPIAYGFSLGKGSNALTIPGTWYVFASVPAWFLGPLLAVYPLRRSFSWWRSRRRRKRGLCPVCAYDLRESPERCPECGYAR